MVPAAAVTTHAKPHAQQQLERDIEVERAAMGHRYRPQRSGPGLLCAAARFGFAVFKTNVSLLEGSDFTPAASATTKISLKTFFSLRTEYYLGTRTAVQSWSGVSAAWCPQQRSRLMPSRTHSSNLHVIRGGARCHGATLSASKFRRGAARQSTATSMAGFLVNCSSAAVEVQKKQSQSLRLTCPEI